MISRDQFSSRTRIPVICAPMFLVTTAAMVIAACTAGIVGVLPRGNFRSLEAFEAALSDIRRVLDGYAQSHPNAVVGPLAVNLAARSAEEEMVGVLDICRRHRVDLLVTALGNPAEVVSRAKDWGAAVYHDVISVRFAEKAIAAGVDGLIAVCWGGGGHSGNASPLVLIPQLRSLFDGAIVMAGAVGSGAAIRAGQVLGADMAYVGTHFIATRESGATTEYKAMLVAAGEGDILYSGAINGSSASWLIPSLRANGLDPKALPQPTTIHGHDHLPDGVRPWRDLWSAGQGAAMIHDVPAVAELIERLAREYEAARQIG